MLRELITVNPRSIKSNPRKGGGKAKKKHKATYRRNPRFLPSASDVTDALLPAAIGGAGALGLSIALGQLTMIPPEWKTGNRGLFVRGAAAFAIGFLARTVLPAKYKRLADQATAGALTVTAYDAVKGIVTQQWPELTLGMYDGDLSAYEKVNWNALPVLSKNGGASLSAYSRAGSGELAGMIPAVR
jgi:hypothetical protein